MRYLVAATLAVSLVFAGSAAVSANGNGNSPAKRVNAGWNCFDVPGLGVHCQPPGAGASSATLPTQVFEGSDPTASDAHFLGTELLIRADLYNGQPCPQEGLDEWVGLDLFGGPEIDYFACHHYSH